MILLTGSQGLDTHELDAHEIGVRLWQGAFPPSGPKVREAGFDMVVLCARELQLPPEAHPGVEVVHAPNDDSEAFPLTKEKLRIAVRAADIVVQRIQAGGKVLVTCAAGLNRSGLVSAIALHKMYGWGGDECIRTVRTKRVASKHHPGKALSNAEFVAAIRWLPARV